MLDAIGQTIKIGDIIAASSNSTFYGNHGICVVTRFGNSNNLEINGSSYVDHKSVIVITSQYQLSFGVFKASEVIAEHKDKFDYTLPEIKKTKRYILVALSTYERNPPSRYFVLEVESKKLEQYDAVQKLNAKFPSFTKIRYFKVRGSYSDSKPRFTYDLYDLSRKAIKDLDLEAFIDSEITSPEALEKLASYEVW